MMVCSEDSLKISVLGVLSVLRSPTVRHDAARGLSLQNAEISGRHVCSAVTNFSTPGLPLPPPRASWHSGKKQTGRRERKGL